MKHCTSLFILGLVLYCASAASGSRRRYPKSPRDEYDPLQFEHKVSRAIHQLSLILDEHRNIQLAEHQDHTYDDKFTIIQAVTVSTLQSIRSILSRVGVQLLPDDGGNMDDAVRIFLQFQKTTQCNFLESKEAKVRTTEDSQKVLGVTVNAAAHYQVVTQHHWSIDESYELKLRRSHGRDDDEVSTNEEVSLMGRSFSTKTKTTVKQKPIESREELLVPEVELTWLFREFALNRTRATTPARNEEMDSLLKNIERLSRATRWIREQLDIIYLPPDQNRSPSRSTKEYDPVLILPWMDKNSQHLTQDDWQTLLRHQEQVLDERLANIEATHPPANHSLFWSADEEKLLTIFSALEETLWHFTNSVGYIENMLREQLFQALGKEITPREFDHYMQHYNHQWLAPEYSPKPFSRAIRASADQTPVGMISIESIEEADRPIETMCRRIAGHTPMAADGDSKTEAAIPDEAVIEVPLDASSRVMLTGDRYLHGWLRHTFTSKSGTGPIQLKARARQFSSFILLVGKMTGPQSMDAKHAIILSNKDQVMIPILTETLPSAKQFRDAITSLSPEQQEFAKAFRAMQLESSVFGIAVVQLKPQLEKVLSLPEGSLNKEMQLTEDLISLFVDYQIPSDLVSYDGDESASPSEKVQVVKAYVASVLQVIETQKEMQLKEEKQRAENRKAQAERQDQERRRKVMWNLDELDGDYSMEVHEEVSSDLDLHSRRPRSTVTSLRTTLSSENNLRSESGRGSNGAATKDSLSSSTSEINESASSSSKSSSSSTETSSIISDLTMIPRLLDKKMETLDKDGALTSTILKAGNVWKLLRQDNLLLPQKTISLFNDNDDSLGKERNKAMDLLDALSKSGALPLNKSEVHVLIGLSHRFEDSVWATLVERNVNPIPKVQLSTLLLGSTIYGVPVLELMANSQKELSNDETVKHLISSMPDLFLTSSLEGEKQES